MKTPREILFQRHQHAQPKLDEIRKKVVREGRRAAVPETRVADTATLPVLSWRELFISLRWHLTGFGAAWLIIVLLNLNIGRSNNLVSTVPAAKIPPPQIILASLRENRRELLEMMQPAESRDVRPVKLFQVQPRSERPYETLTA
jgi:hypothetical protein